jgi:hypothetical protein
MDPTGNTVYIVEAWFTAPLLSNGLPTVFTRLNGKVLERPLPSNGFPVTASTCVAGMHLPSRIHITI